VKVLVTGATGRVGPAVVERLARSGHEILAVGRAAAADVKGARYAGVDIFNAASLAEALKDVNAIVHLAAIAGPAGWAPEEVFRVNALATFTVYEAAARAGVGRVVTASSINAFGYNFGTRSFALAALPVDESMPGFTTDAYSFSKQVVESIADYAWRRDGIRGFCLRLPWVAPALFSTRDVVQKHAAFCRASWESLMAVPEARRRERVREWIARRETFQAGRHGDGVGPHPAFEMPDILMQGRTDFWTRVDERDAAQAVEKGLSAPVEGSPALYVNDGCNYTGIPSLDMARVFFEGTALDETRLGGGTSLVCIDAARGALGYEPEHPVSRWL
jgi:NAD(P)-dependent dehydrogenase (short-subunit alcohol dehydrogenase family)